MLLRIPSSQSLLANARSLGRRPSRLTVRALAAGLLAVAGLGAGLSAGSQAAAGAASNLAISGHALAVRGPGVRAAGTAGAPVVGVLAGPVASRHTAPDAAAAYGAQASVRIPSRELARPQAASPRPDRPAQPAVSPRGGAVRHPAVRHPAVRHPAVRHPAVRHPAVRHPAAPRRAAPPRPVAKPAPPYLIYDSTRPSAIPAHHVVAGYANGLYAASPSRLAGRGPVVWIDITGTDYAASALDVEPGDATPAMAARWAWHRLSADPDAVARIYTMRSEWPAVQAAAATLPAWMHSRIHWWIADPTGYPHIVPGSEATQWYWGPSYDITTATPQF